MFDIMKLGKNISAKRKALGMTQMELADKLGISYQAVSNWERGQTAPDISKLGEIAEILECSIDELLGSQRTAEVIKQVEQEVENPDITPQELADVAPILKPEQVDRTFGSVFSKFSNLGETISKKINEAMKNTKSVYDAIDGKAISDRVNDAIGDRLDKIHEKIDSIDPEKIHIESRGIGGDGMAFTVIANSDEEWKAFREYLDPIVKSESPRRELESLAKRFSVESVREKLEEKLDDYDEEFDNHVEDIVEEISDELEDEREDERRDRNFSRAERKIERAERKAERMVERAERKAERHAERAGRHGRWYSNTFVFDGDPDRPISNLEALARLAPFLPTETLNRKLSELADDENADASVLCAIAPHADDDVVSDVARKLFERSGDLLDVVALAPFMDDDVIDEIALKALERTDDFSSIAGLAPFISSETLAKLAHTQFDKTGEVGSLAALAPFLDGDDLGGIAKKALHAGAPIGSLSSIAPFLDADDIGELAKSIVARGESVDHLAAIAPFMDSDDLGEVALASIKRGGNVGEIAGIAPFVDEEQLGEIAMAALDNGATFADLHPILPFLGNFSEEMWRRAASAPKPPTPPTPPVPPTPPTPKKSEREANEELIQSLVTLLKSSGEDAVNPLRNVVDPKILGEAIRRWEQNK